MKTFLFGLVIGILVVPLAVLTYFRSGSAPVATSAPPMPFERMLANGALHATIAKEKPAAVPIAADEANFLAGRTFIATIARFVMVLRAASRPRLPKACSPSLRTFFAARA